MSALPVRDGKALGPLLEGVGRNRLVSRVRAPLWRSVFGRPATTHFLSGRSNARVFTAPWLNRGAKESAALTTA